MAASREQLDALSRTDTREAISPDVLAPILTSPPFIPSRSLINCRDVGAVPGSAVPAGRAYRCGTLDMAAKDPEAVAWLGANVRRVFDLRLEAERRAAPDPEIPGVENVWLEGQGGYPTPKLADFAVDGGRTAWKAQYMSVALVYRPIIRAVMEHIRDRPTEPFLFHCTVLICNFTDAAGRDRTGVLAGLLHHLAGTPADDAVRDYMISRIGTEPARDKLLQFAMTSVHVTDPKTPGFMNLISMRPEFWEGFLEGLQEEFGGWDGYVTKGLGLSEEDLATIKKNIRL